MTVDASEISGLKVLIKVQIGVMKQTLSPVLCDFITQRDCCIVEIFLWVRAVTEELILKIF